MGFAIQERRSVRIYEPQRRHFVFHAFSCPTTVSFSRLCLAAVVMAFFPHSAAAETITVRLRSGRSFTAAVDERTDGECLWLRFDKGTSHVLRPVAWNNIAAAWRAGQRLDPDDLRAAANELVSPAPNATAPRDRQSAPAREESHVNSHAGRSPPVDDLSNEPVRSLRLSAATASWDGDIERDGIVVEIQPLDASGYLVPIGGTLEVDLLGDPYLSPTRGEDYHQLGHWTCAVSSHDFGPEGASYRFTYQAVHPVFQDDISPYAMVHVRLEIPGQGVFDATTNQLRLQPFNGLRGRVRQVEGTSFFANEQTGQGVTRRMGLRQK